MSYACTEAHHLRHVAAGIPNIVEADDVGGFAEERVSGLRFDHRVQLPFVRFCIKDALKAANEFDACGGACERQSGCGWRADPVFFETVDTDVLNEMANAWPQVCLIFRLADV